MSYKKGLHSILYFHIHKHESPIIQGHYFNLLFISFLIKYNFPSEALHFCRPEVVVGVFEMLQVFDRNNKMKILFHFRKCRQSALSDL